LKTREFSDILSNFVYCWLTDAVHKSSWYSKSMSHKGIIVNY